MLISRPVPELKLFTETDSLSNLDGMLQRFCENPIATLCDIKDMFMHLAKKHEDQPALRFLWPKENLFSHYQFPNLTFGAACSRF